MKWIARGALFGGGLLLAIMVRDSEWMRSLGGVFSRLADENERLDTERDKRLAGMIAGALKENDGRG